MKKYPPTHTIRWNKTTE